MTNSKTKPDVSLPANSFPGTEMAEEANSTAMPPPTAPADSMRWSGRTRGGYFGNWFFMQLIRWLGLRWAYAWLVLIAGYFTIASPSNYRVSVDYLKRVLPPQPYWKWPGLVFRHFYSSGITLLDRVAVIMGRTRIECRMEGEEAIRERLAQGQGVILLGSHVGSTEIGGHFLNRLGKPVNLVVLEREALRIRQLFDKALANKKFQLLTTDGHPLRSIPIVAALRRGEIVALSGDRTFGGTDLALPFLSGLARFPVGAYLLAAVSGAPLFQVFVVRERIGHYRFFSFPETIVPRDLRRAQPESLLPYVTQYADRLASVVRQYPLQWYNFYPFWNDEKT